MFWVMTSHSEHIAIVIAFYDYLTHTENQQLGNQQKIRKIRYLNVFLTYNMYIIHIRNGMLERNVGIITAFVAPDDYGPFGALTHETTTDLVRG